MIDQPIRRTMREQIADRIRADILSKRFPPGESLREQALANRYGVSRAPVRDALMQLTSEGLLVAKPNCGVRVGPAPSEDIQPVVVDVRLQIERFALNRMFDRLDEVDLKPLDDILESLRAACAASDIAAVVVQDMALHRFIVESADSTELFGLWLPIVSRMFLHYSRHDTLMDSYREHAAIVKAVRDGDREAAVDALEANIR